MAEGEWGGDGGGRRGPAICGHGHERAKKMEARRPTQNTKKVTLN